MPIQPRYRPSRAPFYLVGAFVGFVAADIAWFLLDPEQAREFQLYLVPVVAFLAMVTMVTPAVLEKREKEVERAARQQSDVDGPDQAAEQDTGPRSSRPTVVLRTSGKDNPSQQ